MITAPLSHFSDKDLEEIQQIVTSTKIANLAKRTIRITVDLALMAKKKQPKRFAIKSKLREECFNYEKNGYNAKDYRSSISNKKKLADKSTEEAKSSWWKRNQAKAARSANNN